MARLLLWRCGLLVLFVGTIGLPLAAQKDTGYLMVSAHPHRTAVFVDNKYFGPAANFGMARKYLITPGMHEIELKESLSEDYVTTVTIVAGKTTKISETMKPLERPKPPFGMLKIEGFDKYAAVYVDGRFVGHKDEFDNGVQGLLLNPGSYEIRVEPTNGDSPMTEKVTIEVNKVSTVAKNVAKK
jgi:hypothetical protein